MKLKLRTRRAETVIHSRNPSSLKLKNTDVQTEEAEECCHGSTVSTSFVSLFMEEDFKKDVSSKAGSSNALTKWIFERHHVKHTQLNGTGTH